MDERKEPTTADQRAGAGTGPTGGKGVPLAYIAGPVLTLLLVGLAAISLATDSILFGEGRSTPLELRSATLVVVANASALLAGVLFFLFHLLAGIGRVLRRGKFLLLRVIASLVPLAGFLAFHILSDSRLWMLYRTMAGK